MERVLSAPIPRCNSNVPNARIAVEKARKQIPKATPALVILPICQELGVFDGRTLSVASDIARKSPVTITITISMGVRTACPVMTRPINNRSTCRSFFITEFSV
jgi:hypothetical protein